MHGGEYLDEVLVEGAAIFFGHVGEQGIGDDAAFDVAHEEKRGADDGVVLAEQIGFRNGDAGIV